MALSKKKAKTKTKTRTKKKMSRLLVSLKFGRVLEACWSFCLELYDANMVVSLCIGKKMIFLGVIV